MMAIHTLHGLGRPGLMALIALALLALPDMAAAQKPEQTPEQTTLEQTLVRAYQSNPQIRSERARQRGTDEEVTRAAAGYRPQINVTAATGRAIDRDQTVSTQQIPNAQNTAYVEDKVHTVTPERRNPLNVVFQVQQALYDGGRTPAAVASAEWLVKRGRAALQSVESGVLGDAITAYYDLYRDQAIVDLAVEHVVSLQRQLAITRARFLVKDVTGTDIAQSEARLARGIADRTQVEGNLAATRSNYLRIVGTPAGRAVAPPPLPADVPANHEEALSFVDNNPDVVSATFAEAQAQADIDVASSALYPKLSASAEALRQDQSEGTTWNYARNSAQVLVELDVPVYDGGVGYSQTRGAKQTALQRHYELASARDKVVDQIERSWQGLITARSQITSITEQKRAADVALDSVSREVLIGTRTVLDQLNAEQELLDAKTGLVRAQHDEAVAVYNLLVAIGRVNPVGLKMVVDAYDAKANYQDVRNRWFGTGINTEPQAPSHDPRIKGPAGP